jgi:hypothetical protein
MIVAGFILVMIPKKWNSNLNVNGEVKKKKRRSLWWITRHPETKEGHIYCKQWDASVVENKHRSEIFKRKNRSPSKTGC